MSSIFFIWLCLFSPISLLANFLSRILLKIPFNYKIYKIFINDSFLFGIMLLVSPFSFYFYFYFYF